MALNSTLNESVNLTNSSFNETEQEVRYYSPLFGMDLSMPEWEALLTILALGLVIIITIVGNILVIVSVFTYTPLKITPNYFIVSLAVSDLTVSIVVLPLNVMLHVVGKWHLGSIVCKMWLTSDVLCCTASILNLCAIALDRYYALSDPIEHARRRTTKFVLGTIAVVWFLSIIICSPPLIGWNNWPSAENWTIDTRCELTDEPGYVLYSALGSFYIPLMIIIFVYIKIWQNMRNRIRKRADASGLNALKKVNDASVAKEDTNKGIPLTERVKKASISISRKSNGSIKCNSCEDTNQNNVGREMINQSLKQGAEMTQGPLNNQNDAAKTENAIELQKIESQVERDPNPTRSKVVPVNGVTIDQNCYDESVTMVSATFESEDTQVAQNDKDIVPSSCHTKHKKGPVQKSDKAVNTTGDLHEPLLNSKNNTRSSKKYLTVDTVFTKRKLSANLSLETGTVSHRLASAVSMNRLTLVADSVSTKDGSSEETQVQKMQREKAKMAQAKERKAARTMAVIVVTFIICWLPFFLMYVILAFVSEFHPKPEQMIPSGKIIQFITWLGYVNSTLNPIIYTVFNNDFRVAISRILACKLNRA